MVNKETLELWKSKRYHGIVKDLSEALNLTPRTINSALNRGKCTPENEKRITEKITELHNIYNQLKNK